jgi:hypothetical protein
VCHDRAVGAFRYLLYAAVAFSLSVYAYRAYRRWLAPDRAARTRADDGPDAGPGRTASPPTALPLDGPPGGPSVPSTAPAPRPARGFGFTDPTLAPPVDPAGSESLVQKVIREEIARNKGQEPAGASDDDPQDEGRRGLFAGAGSERTERRVDRVSVAAALTGVRLPDDLVPLVVTGEADPHHVTFITSGLPAATVGGHLGDELERLGYQVRSESDVVAVATKGTVVLRVTLHPDPASEQVDGAPRYPTAGRSSVVVEFET